ncbi:CGNR zinc finger domain-containing protein [Pedobacter sp. Du54]|uniref:CGNR zinc finger domain-containing protein n=1 Tax=Pedobacter anseongensis TaxID=3133439 RepID=UPI003096186D
MTIESSLLCHNFINTVYAWRGKNLNEYLKSYDDLIQWCERLKVLSSEMCSALGRYAEEHPDTAEAALKNIKKVREMLYHLVSAIAAHNDVEIARLLSKGKPLLVRAASKFSIVYDEGEFREVLVKDPSDLQAPLWPVLQSLKAMLLDVDARRIKECPACGWVFLDQTKNRGRKWCSAVECGTKDKMARYLLKKKAASENG